MKEQTIDTLIWIVGLTLVYILGFLAGLGRCLI